MSYENFDIHRIFYSEYPARIENVWRRTGGSLDKMSGKAQTNFFKNVLSTTRSQLKNLLFSKHYFGTLLFDKQGSKVKFVLTEYSYHTVENLTLDLYRSNIIATKCHFENGRFLQVEVFLQNVLSD